MMKDGLIGIAFTLATASRSVPSASGFAALSKPIWLSLICKNVNPVDSAASESPINPTEWGTPPLTAQSTPVPAQTMHSSTSRRPNPCPRSSKPSLAMSHLPVGQTAPNGAAKQETRPFQALFPVMCNFSIFRFPPVIAHFGDSNDSSIQFIKATFGTRAQGHSNVHQIVERARQRLPA